MHWEILVIQYKRIFGIFCYFSDFQAETKSLHHDFSASKALIFVDRGKSKFVQVIGIDNCSLNFHYWHLFIFWNPTFWRDLGEGGRRVFDMTDFISCLRYQNTKNFVFLNTWELRCFFMFMFTLFFIMDNLFFPPLFLDRRVIIFSSFLIELLSSDRIFSIYIRCWYFYGGTKIVCKF